MLQTAPRSCPIIPFQKRSPNFSKSALQKKPVYALYSRVSTKDEGQDNVNRDELARLDAEGLTMAEIGEQLGISAASVCRMLKAHRIQRGTSLAIA